MSDQQELDQLIELRESISRRIAFLRNRIRRRDMDNIAEFEIPRRNGTHTFTAVSLRPYIQKWIDNGDTLAELARAAEVDERTLRGILNGERAWVRDFTGEAILVQGLGRPDLYRELRVAPPNSHYWEE